MRDPLASLIMPASGAPATTLVRLLGVGGETLRDGRCVSVSRSNVEESDAAVVRSR